MIKNLKAGLLSYGVITVLSYYLLMMRDNKGIAVPLFVGLQFILIALLIIGQKDVCYKSGIFFLVPAFLLSLNPFLSASYLWNFLNAVVTIVLFGAAAAAFTGAFHLKKDSWDFLIQPLRQIFTPFKYLKIPFIWMQRPDKKPSARVWKILVGILITIPILIVIILILSMADEIFFHEIKHLLYHIIEYLNWREVIKLIFSVFVGLYLFGLLFSVFTKREKTAPKPEPAVAPDGDLTIISCILCGIVIVYLLFAVVQFRYLFAGGGALPYELNYAAYARRGFFELIFLSVINLLIVLACTSGLKNRLYSKTKSGGAVFVKILLLCLCVLTLVLAASSFYRMNLYDQQYGFTRLRLFVYIFLWFECAAILMTAVYVLWRKWNIGGLYFVLALGCYLTINLVNIDGMIAQRNIALYETQIQNNSGSEEPEGEEYRRRPKGIDVWYLSTLSADAAPQMAKLRESEFLNPEDQEYVKNYFERVETQVKNAEKHWYSYNYSLARAKEYLQ